MRAEDDLLSWYPGGFDPVFTVTPVKVSMDAPMGFGLWRTIWISEDDLPSVVQIAGLGEKFYPIEDEL
jgi:hypothetical protein